MKSVSGGNDVAAAVRGMERALLGSTAERVIVNAPCPVLVVKHEEKQ